MPVPMSSAEIVEDIAVRIANGEAGYLPGDQLPSYSQLADLYSVSPATAARVYRDLRMMRLVKGSTGRGVYVAEPES